MIKGFSDGSFVWMFIFWIRPTSTTVNVTAYDGTGIVQQQPLTLRCNYTRGGSDQILDFNWRRGSVVILSGSVTAQTSNFLQNTAWTTSGVFLGDYTSSLTIQLPASSVTPSVAGQYTCSVNTLTERVLDTATATVQYTPQIKSIFPSSKTVTEFSRLQIDCSSYTTPGNPPTTSYTWTYGGSTISSAAVLDIHNISRERRGQFTCTASNTLGSDSETVSVDIQHVPQIESTFPFSRTVTEFSRLQIDCSSYTTPGKPPTTNYTWIYGGSTITSGAVLDINNIGKERRGQYTCTASNTVGSDSETVSVDVQYAPKIKSTFPSSRNVTESSRLQIDCSSYSTPGNPPTTSYTWSYGGFTISSGAVLDMNNIGRDRRGQYTCTASNTFTPTGGSQQQGIARATVILDVQYGPGNSVQVTPEGTTALVEGSGPFTATCTADCNPDCSISWRSDTRNLNSVSMSNVSQTDQGNYTCQAQNRIGGPREKTITLVVYYLGRSKLLLDKTEVVENKTANLICNVESNPTAELEIRNVDNNTVLVERDINRLQFTIDRVKCLHNGTFLCTARNIQIGTVSSITNINVLCSPRQDFRQKHDNIVAKLINETAALVADVIANPVPEFHWFRQETVGLTNISRDTIHSISNSRLQSVLYINISRTQDYGDYVLEMENSQGRKQLLFTLTSKGSPFPPTNFRASSVSQTSVTLMWTSNNDGGAPQNFQLKFRSFVNDWINTLENGVPDAGEGSTVSTEVPGLQPSTRYGFTLFSTNVYGSSQKVTLNITTADADISVPSASNSSNVGVIAGVVTAVCLLVLLVIVPFFLYRRGVLQESRCYKRENRGTPTSKPVPDLQGKSDLTTESVSPYSDMDHINSERQTYTELKTYQNNQTISDYEESRVLRESKSPMYENTHLKKKDPLYINVSST